MATRSLKPCAEVPFLWGECWLSGPLHMELILLVTDLPQSRKLPLSHCLKLWHLHRTHRS